MNAPVDHAQLDAPEADATLLSMMLGFMRGSAETAKVCDARATQSLRDADRWAQAAQDADRRAEAARADIKAIVGATFPGVDLAALAEALR